MARLPELPDCPCGAEHPPLEPASRRFLARTIERKGPNLEVKTPIGTWLVPRVYIARHGLKATELPLLAAYFNWPRCDEV